MTGFSGMERKSGVAEGVGFEPTDAFTSPVFKTGALDHSATLPEEPNYTGTFRFEESAKSLRR